MSTTCITPPEIYGAAVTGFKKPGERALSFSAVPLPKPIYNEEGQQLPANYANFLIINHAV